MVNLTTLLTFSRSTKNKHLYVVSPNHDDYLGSVYIEKSALPTEPPKQIMVTITDSDEAPIG